MTHRFNLIGKPTKGEILAQTLIGYLPQSIREYITDHATGSKIAHARMTTVLATKVAKELVESKLQALLEGKGRDDIMTLLSKPASPRAVLYRLTFFLEVKANTSEDQKRRLDEEELLSQMRYVNYIVINGCTSNILRTIILGGHETTSNTLSWILFELARNPSIQKKLRKEIRLMEQIIQSRVDREFTPADLDSMTYLNAFVKVTIAPDFNVAITHHIAGVTSIASPCCYYLP